MTDVTKFLEENSPAYAEAVQRSIADQINDGDCVEPDEGEFLLALTEDYGVPIHICKRAQQYLDEIFEEETGLGTKGKASDIDSELFKTPIVSPYVLSGSKSFTDMHEVADIAGQMAELAVLSDNSSK